MILQALILCMQSIPVYTYPSILLPIYIHFIDLLLPTIAGVKPQSAIPSPFLSVIVDRVYGHKNAERTPTLEESFALRRLFRDSVCQLDKE